MNATTAICRSTSSELSFERNFAHNFDIYSSYADKAEILFAMKGEKRTEQKPKKITKRVLKERMLRHLEECKAERVGKLRQSLRSHKQFMAEQELDN